MSNRTMLQLLLHHIIRLVDQSINQEGSCYLEITNVIFEESTKDRFTISEFMEVMTG